MYADEEVDATVAEGRVAQLLDVPRGAPLLRMRQVIYSSKIKPTIYVIGFYRSERHSLVYPAIALRHGRAYGQFRTQSRSKVNGYRWIPGLLGGGATPTRSPAVLLHAGMVNKLQLSEKAQGDS